MFALLFQVFNPFIYHDTMSCSIELCPIQISSFLHTKHACLRFILDLASRIGVVIRSSFESDDNGRHGAINPTNAPRVCFIDQSRNVIPRSRLRAHAMASTLRKTLPLRVTATGFATHVVGVRDFSKLRKKHRGDTG